MNCTESHRSSQSVSIWAEPSRTDYPGNSVALCGTVQNCPEQSDLLMYSDPWLQLILFQGTNYASISVRHCRCGHQQSRPHWNIIMLLLRPFLLCAIHLLLRRWWNTLSCQTSSYFKTPMRTSHSTPGPVQQHTLLTRPVLHRSDLYKGSGGQGLA